MFFYEKFYKLSIYNKFIALFRSFYLFLFLSNIHHFTFCSQLSYISVNFRTFAQQKNY